MTAPKDTPFLTFALLAILTQSLHPSQMKREALSPQTTSSACLAASSSSACPSLSVTTAKSEELLTVERFYQLIVRGDACLKDDAIETARQYFELAFSNTCNLEIHKAQKSQNERVGKILILKGFEFLRQDNVLPAIDCYECAYKITKHYPQNSKLHAEAEANLRETLITIGLNLVKQNKQTDAYEAFQYAYALGKSSSPDRQIMVTAHIGKTLIEQNKDKEALPYLEEGYEIAQKYANEQRIKEIVSVIAGSIGRIYWTDNGVAPNYKKAFTFLKQAQKSRIPLVALRAANSLGSLYTYGLGRKKDLLKARQYFSWSLNGADALIKKAPFESKIFCIYEKASYSLFGIKVLQLEEFDKFYQSIQENPTEELIKQASTMLAEAQKIQAIPSEFNAPLEKEITSGQMKLKKLLNQLEQNLKQQRKQERKKKRRAAFTQTPQTENATNQGSIEGQASTKAALENEAKKSAAEDAAKVQIMLKQAEIEFEAYRNKPSVDTRYTNAKTLYFEALQLSRKNPEIRQTIMQKIDKLFTLRERYHDNTNPITSDSKEERQDSQAARWTILDPNNLTQGQSAAKTRLQELATNPLQVLQAEKFQALSQACSTRCGSGDRIIYVVLPSYHSVGIINAGPHSNYEKVELLRHREDWFLNPNSQAITIAIEQAKKRNDEEQVRALTAFLQQISSQSSSTDSKEAKEQKS